MRDNSPEPEVIAMGDGDAIDDGEIYDEDDV